MPKLNGNLIASNINNQRKSFHPIFLFLKFNEILLLSTRLTRRRREKKEIENRRNNQRSTPDVFVSPWGVSVFDSPLNVIAILATQYIYIVFGTFICVFRCANIDIFLLLTHIEAHTDTLDWLIKKKGRTTRYHFLTTQ